MVEEIIEKINAMNESEIEKALKDVKETEDMNRAALEVCYDKDMRIKLRIPPISDIKHKDFRKAQLYIYFYTLKDKEETKGYEKEKI